MLKITSIMTIVESAPLISLHIIERKGLLFIDNIRCKAKDCEWYEETSY